ncbi:MAG: ribonuclease III domain-containing protein [Eubacteriales bacterium]|nr:ribonuclease III domain-containing protein [Eubacteriales bacterium]
MEEGVGSMLSSMKKTFGFPDRDLRTYSPLTLAYIGDSIYDLVIRTLVVESGNCPPQKLHKKASSLVKAQAQAEMIERLLPFLTEEEQQIYRRGRNAKSYTMAKNATMHDYRKATGLEAVMGYLYLKDETERLLELVKIGLDGAAAQEDACKSTKDTERENEHEI